MNPQKLRPWIFSFLLFGIPLDNQARTTSNSANVWFNEQGECEFKEIANHISRIAVSPSGLIEAKSIEKAQELARQKLQEQFCTSLSEEDCAKLSRNISTVDYAKHPNKKQICSLARMPVQLATDPTGRITAEKNLTKSLSKIISRSQNIAAKKNLYFTSAIRSDSQCVAGLTGDGLVAQMKEAAIQKGISVVEQPSNALIIETKLIPQKEDWKVEVSGLSPTITKQALGSFSLPQHMIDPNSLQDSCIPSTDDRLKRGYDTHSSGLSIEVSLGKEKTSWCEGDKGQLLISASQPAYIRVFSVVNSPTQQSVMVFPHPVHKGSSFDPYEASTSFDLGTMEFFPTSSTPKQENIMVLAVPSGSNFSLLEEIKSPCFTTKPIDEWLPKPKDVALQILSYTIYPVGSQAGALQCNLENISLESRKQSTENWTQFLSTLEECSIE